MRFWIIYILFQISFLGMFLGVLASAFFNFSQLDNHGGRQFLHSSPPHPHHHHPKITSYDPGLTAIYYKSGLTFCKNTLFQYVQVMYQIVSEEIM